MGAVLSHSIGFIYASSAVIVSMLAMIIRNSHPGLWKLLWQESDVSMKIKRDRIRTEAVRSRALSPSKRKSNHTRIPSSTSRKPKLHQSGPEAASDPNPTAPTSTTIRPRPTVQFVPPANNDVPKPPQPSPPHSPTTASSSQSHSSQSHSSQSHSSHSRHPPSPYPFPTLNELRDDETSLRTPPTTPPPGEIKHTCSFKKAVISPLSLTRRDKPHVNLSPAASPTASEKRPSAARRFSLPTHLLHKTVHKEPDLRNLAEGGADEHGVLTNVTSSSTILQSTPKRKSRPRSWLRSGHSAPNGQLPTMETKPKTPKRPISSHSTSSSLSSPRSATSAATLLRTPSPKSRTAVLPPPPTTPSCKSSTSPQPVRRTNPYDAPYFFPAPGDPGVAEYVRQLKSRRDLSPLQLERVLPPS